MTKLAENHQNSLINQDLLKNLKSIKKVKKKSDESINKLIADLEMDRLQPKKAKSDSQSSSKTFLNDSNLKLAQEAKSQTFQEILEIRQAIETIGKIYKFNDQLNLYHKISEQKNGKSSANSSRNRSPEVALEGATSSKKSGASDSKSTSKSTNFTKNGQSWSNFNDCVILKQTSRRSEHISKLTNYANQSLLFLWGGGYFLLNLERLGIELDL